MRVRVLQRLGVLAAATVLTLVGPAGSAEKSQREEVREHFDTVSQVATTVAAVYPPAIAVVGVYETAFSVLDFFGYFGSSTPGGGDPYLNAIGVLQQQIDRLTARMDAAEARLADLEKHAVKEANNDRIDKMLLLHNQARDSFRRLDEAIRTKDQAEIRLLLEASLDNAELFHKGIDVWEWFDPDAAGGTLTPGFRSSPALEYYLFQLQVIALGIEALDEPPAAKAKRYGPRLQEHLAALAGRDSQGREATSRRTPLGPSIDQAIACSWQFSGKYADASRQCHARAECFDGMTGRTVRSKTYVSWSVAESGDAALCSLPMTTDTGLEWELETAYGRRAIEAAAEGLTQLALKGTMRPPAQGQFKGFKLRSQTLIFAVNPRGGLQAFTHKIIDDPEAVRERVGKLKPPVDLPPPVFGDPKSKEPVSPGKPPPILPPTGRGEPPSWVHDFEAGVPVGPGWGDCEQIFPMVARPVIAGSLYARPIVYCAGRDGMLTWRRIDDPWSLSPRQGPVVTAGSGWRQGADGLSSIVTGGDGVFYILRMNGLLQWYRHDNGGSTDAAPNWAPRREVGSGWQIFPRVFGGGQGVIYAIQADGDLRWYRHDGYRDGGAGWTGWKNVGDGWGGFRLVFSAGQGDVYAVTAGGDLVWYWHQEWQTGGRRWIGPVKLASGWGGYRLAAALQLGTPSDDGGVK